ncbi:GNAT family N-acetyltransferase [Angustibacter aerolatus]
MLAGKPVPPPPARRGQPHRALGIDDREDVAADGWRPLEQALLGDRWRLRAADGFTARANSVLALGDLGGAPDPTDPTGAFELAEAWYRERGLPPRFAVSWPLDAEVDPSPDGGARRTPLDLLLRERGYRLDTPTLVLTAALREVAAATVPPGSSGLPAGWSLVGLDAPDDAWLGVYRYRGEPLPGVAERLLRSAPGQVLAAVRGETGRTVAVARGASSRGWTGVTATEVVPEHRRRGLAGRLLGAIAEWGLTRGDRSGYLQVAETNAPARRLYDRVGFVPHHGYQYRVLV